ncbi:PREDICTED: GPI ethanolamine phosphate transferase 1 [Nicrophorus vespilloides]|uniref:GPI ethanolamine phosphate transferase 1 n=1 Tax=Nicrophorus vespilloides TaxID=110193 RepID=A0ABM1N4B9_NICVS|nr:PREDICTED: GPI ethanolamine phosphate transferase 1 [Nicrophorus vespilloides]XP_017781669.1 PREDICTED: GPI ethanolamine phosphate transferase 1 [Nicrophorus vespilloides]
MKQESRSFTKLWIGGILIHLTVLGLILDLYFKSPVNTGMTPYKSDKPFAQRAVLFVADGLRAETFFNSKNHRTPYLSQLCNGTGAFGVINTRVPTESRPGHVAILAGLYEDPSAIFTGWKANLVSFDSIINQSNYVWALGSPDIVNIFPKLDTCKLHVASYNPEDEDFSGRSSTINLDTWVFDQMKKLMTQHHPCLADIIKLEQKLKTIQYEKQQYSVLREQCISDNKGCQGELCPHEENLCLSKLNKVLVPLMAAEIDMFAHMTVLKNNCKATCSELCEEGNFFFLHLLGMDSAGHIHKPNSKEYFNNLIAVDKGIHATVEAVDKFYGDNATVYIFTSDHGMTNWGSHGDGSDHETKVPYIVWGKGIKGSSNPHDMEQADLAPLIATLIGAPIPINSVGVLQEQLLDGSAVEIAQALLVNVKQISEQYLILCKTFENTLLFKEFLSFTEGNTVESQIANLKLLLENGKTDMVIMKCHKLIEDLKHGITYLSNYYYIPKMVCIMSGFISWMVALLVSTLDPPRNRRYIQEYISNLESQIFKILASVMLIIISFLYNLNSSYTAYIYALFPAIVIITACSNDDLMGKLISTNFNKKTRDFMIFLISSLMIQFLVKSFFNKIYCAVIFGILFLWMFFVNINRHVKILWMACCAILIALLYYPTTTNFTYIGFGLGVCVWLLFYLNVIRSKLREFVEASHYKRTFFWKALINIPLLLFTLSVCNSIYIANSFINENGVFMMNKSISWIMTVLALVSIFLSPTTIYGRFGQIASCLIVPLTLMSVNIDLFVYTVIVGTLYLWIRIEGTIYNSYYNLNYIYYNALHDLKTSTRLSDFRKTFIYLSLVIGYYFAIGNIASVNGFDPMWTRAYVSTFNPILMCLLIILKMVIPFFIITCAFHTVNLLTKANSVSTFKILLLYCDQMVINFILRIRNEGSWKDIGQSLSHFVIMEAMILVIIIFYAFSYYITRQKMPYHKKMFEVICKEQLNENEWGIINQYRHMRQDSRIQFDDDKSEPPNTSLESVFAPNVPVNPTTDDDKVFKKPAIPKMKKRKNIPCRFGHTDFGTEVDYIDPIARFPPGKLPLNTITDRSQMELPTPLHCDPSSINAPGPSNIMSEAGPSRIHHKLKREIKNLKRQSNPGILNEPMQLRPLPCMKSKIKKFKASKKGLIIRPVIPELPNEFVQAMLQSEPMPISADSNTPKRKDDKEDD